MPHQATREHVNLFSLPQINIQRFKFVIFAQILLVFLFFFENVRMVCL